MVKQTRLLIAAVPSSGATQRT